MQKIEIEVFSVDEKLPKDRQTVLVFTGNGNIVKAEYANFLGNMQFCLRYWHEKDAGIHAVVANVTQWCELPRLKEKL
jgi:hypothetical protein